MKRPSELIKTIIDTPLHVEFMPTGYKRLDLFLDGGFMRKEMVVLGGETGIGKSYVAGQILYKMAARGFKTAYYSLEISNEMVMSRIIGSMANIKANRIMTHQLEKHEKSAINPTITSLMGMESLMVFHDDIYDFETLKKEIEEGEFDFVVIDFIQNVYIKGMSEYDRLSFLSIEFQKLAKKVDCTIMILSQLSNDVSDGQKNKPRFKGSGAIGTAADLAVILTREDPELDVKNNAVFLTLVKNRRGISGARFNLFFKHPGGLLYEQ